MGKMAFILTPVMSALLIAGCEDRSDSGKGTQPQPTDNAISAPKDAPAQPMSVHKYTAVLSCKVNGTPVGASACFFGDSEASNGSLKIKSGGAVKQYAPYDFAAFNQAEISVPLSKPFAIQAQANSDSAYILHVEIRQDGRAIFQDAASSFGAIAYDGEIN